MKSKAIPEGFHSLITDLVVRDVKAAIEFYKRAVSSGAAVTMPLADAFWAMFTKKS